MSPKHFTTGIIKKQANNYKNKVTSNKQIEANNELKRKSKTRNYFQ